MSVRSWRTWIRSWVLLPYGWYGVTLVGPLCVLLMLTISEFSAGAPPYQFPFQWVGNEVLQLRFCFEPYSLVWKDPFYRTAFVNSFILAGTSTVIALFLSYPMAYGIARSKRRLIWLMISILPFFTSFLVRIYAWITLLSTQGIITQFLQCCGFSVPPLMNNPYAVIIGMVYSYLPFMIFPLYAVLEKMDPHLLEAAYDLGCKPFSAFWRITVPLSRPGIVSGSILVFIPAMGEYLIPELLGGPTSLTIGRLIWNEFFTNRDWPVASTLAVVLIIILFFPIFLFEKVQTFRKRKVRL